MEAGRAQRPRSTAAPGPSPGRGRSGHSGNRGREFATVSAPIHRAPARSSGSRIHRTRRPGPGTGTCRCRSPIWPSTSLSAYGRCGTRRRPVAATTATLDHGDVDRDLQATAGGAFRQTRTNSPAEVLKCARLSCAPPSQPGLDLRQGDDEVTCREQPQVRGLRGRLLSGERRADRATKVSEPEPEHGAALAELELEELDRADQHDAR